MQSHTFVLRCVLVLVITLAMLPRVLQRAHHNRNRTRVLTFNCRTLLADVRLQELDYALTEKGILICALQETRRDGFKSETTENYEFFWYGECSGHRVSALSFIRVFGIWYHQRAAYPIRTAG